VTAVVLALKAAVPVEELEIVLRKPFCEATGPENVVNAMIFSLHAS
jgi:hypothetical protein